MSEKNPLGSVSFIVSATFLGLITLGALFIALWPEDEKGSPPSEQSPPSASPSVDPTIETGSDDVDAEEASLTPSASGSLCGLERHETEFHVLFPEAETTWTMINGMQAPGSPVNGPGVVEENVRYCYSRTPEGAVLATANFLVLTNTGRDRMTGEWERLVAPGPGRSPFIESIESREGTSEVPGQVSAAKVVSYSEDDARISIGLLASDGLRASMTFDLTWAEGDWKIVVDENGEGDPSFTLLDDFAGFTPWAAI
ncbi:hypothetical protein [Nocardiopsis sp. ATB16-24]|uniref:hypothetical protein n=1 Tax=Nocardiopsis sp. ATB16-24 TaxID=3019555 RepID=UPI00255275DC|nr:hypothetical protein [Nocardiopsis sp. ATB16-24]